MPTTYWTHGEVGRQSQSEQPALVALAVCVRFLEFGVSSCEVEPVEFGLSASHRRLSWC